MTSRPAAPAEADLAGRRPAGAGPPPATGSAAWLRRVGGTFRAEPNPVRRGLLSRHRTPILLSGLLVVLLVAAAALSIGLLRHAWISNLDRQLHSASDRYAALMDDPSDNDHDADDDFNRMVGPTAGTLGAVVADGRLQSVAVLGRDSAVPGRTAARLVSLRPTSGPRSVQLPALGYYRLAVRGGPTRFEVVGLPLRPIQHSVDVLLAGEAAGLAGILALLAGVSLYWVRRTPAAGGSGDEAGLRALIAEASHELRTPAAIIHSYAELAEQSASELPPPVDRALQRIGSESARMGRMVEDLLVLSRFEGGYRPQLAEVDLTKLVLDAVDDARVAGRQDHWELLVPDQPVEVVGNARWLFQAMAAVLANVRAHTPPGTTVRVELRRAAGHAELSIADDGPGIPAEILPAVFERFVRSEDGARYDGLIGVGLGLSVVRQIMQAHAGSISVHSGSAGAEFVLRLPLADAG